MSDHHADPLAHPEVQQGSSGRYVTGFFASTVLMLGAFLLTQAHSLSGIVAAEVLLGLLTLALASQASLFYGLNLSKEQIWKSVSLALAIPLFIITVGFTVLVFSSLYGRTMLPMGGMPMAAQSTLLQ